MNQQTLKIVSLVALAATIVPSLLYFVGVLGHSAVIGTALVGTLVWFVATPLWMGSEPEIDDKEVQI